MNTPELPTKAQELVITCWSRSRGEGRTENRRNVQRLYKETLSQSFASKRPPLFCPKRKLEV